MIDILDELTEIPFTVYWDKYQEQNPGDYNQLLAKKHWFYMYAENRIDAFINISKGVFVKGQEPSDHLKTFCE